MGKKSQPSGKGAANIQASAEQDIATQATYADRPDQFTPWGSLTWSQEETIDPATGEAVTRWVQNQSLDPSVQGLYDNYISDTAADQQARRGLLNRAYTAMGERADFDQFGDPAEFAYSPDAMRLRAEDAAYQRATSRLDPQFETQRRQLEQRLANQGLSPGDRAYDSAMDSFNRGRADAYATARLDATAEGRSESGQMWNQAVQQNEMANALRDQRIQEYIGERQYDLGEANLVASEGFPGFMQTVSGG